MEIKIIKGHSVHDAPLYENRKVDNNDKSIMYLVNGG